MPARPPGCSGVDVTRSRRASPRGARGAGARAPSRPSGTANAGKTSSRRWPRPCGNRRRPRRTTTRRVARLWPLRACQPAGRWRCSEPQAFATTHCPPPRRGLQDSTAGVFACAKWSKPDRKSRAKRSRRSSPTSQKGGPRPGRGRRPSLVHRWSSDRAPWGVCARRCPPGRPPSLRSRPRWPGAGGPVWHRSGRARGVVHALGSVLQNQ